MINVTEIHKSIQAFLPVVLLLIAVGIAGFLFECIVDPSSGDNSKNLFVHLPTVIELCDNQGEYIQPFTELKYRMLWAMSVLFFVLAFLINFSFVVQVFKKLKVNKKWLLISWVPLLVIGIFLGIKGLPAEMDFTFNQYLLIPLKKSPLIKWSVDLIEYGGAIMLFILAFTCFLILINVKLETDKPKTFNRKANLLCRYDRNVRLLLYGATLTLIAGTLHSAAIYNWSLTMIDPGIIIPVSGKPMKYYEEAAQVSGAMGAINGLFYTILMLTIFAPTFAILRNKSKELALKANPDKPYSDVQEWLRMRNLDQGFSQQILPILSTLGPAIIGGPLISLLEIL